jgi:hypothetical protein
MKKLLILIYFAFAAVCFSQGLDISISYTNGEKSKDSHTTEESIAIGGYDAAYSVKYSGHRSPEQVDDSKTCRFSKKNIKTIKDFIIEKGLNKNDSLFDESSKYKSYEVFVNISIAVTIDGQDYKIKVNGDTDEIGHKDLYKNVIELINKVRKMIEDC